MSLPSSIGDRLCTRSSFKSGRFDFYPIGFYNDQYLFELVDTIIPVVDAFVETGANVGSTLNYVARRYPNTACISCEPDREAYNAAVENTAERSNVRLYNDTSQEFFSRLTAREDIRFDRPTLFWLDAHGYGFEWPLLDEVGFITRVFDQAFLLIDDFRVPDRDEFECSIEQIVRDRCAPGRSYRLFYPCYTEKTSQHAHRSWGLVTVDVDGWSPPTHIASEVKGPLAAV